MNEIYFGYKTYCYENESGVVKMVNKSSKKKLCACLYDQQINKNITTSILKKVLRSKQATTKCSRKKIRISK